MLFRRVLIILVACAFIGINSYAETVRIAVVKSRSLVPYEDAYQHIKKELKANSIEFSVYDLKGNKENSESIFEKIKMSKVNLIITMGSLAAKSAKEKVKDIPIVFSYVVNPVASGLVPDHWSSGSNMTGVTMDIPIEMQLSNFRSIVSGINKIGVFYNENETGNIISKAKVVARNMQLTLIAFPIKTSEELPRKINALKEVDALWMVADSVVFTPKNAEYILLYTIKEKVPFMGISEQFVKAGALCGLYLDQKSFNDQIVGQINDILKGKEPAGMPVQFPQKVNLAINNKVAKKIGIVIAPSILEKAEVVYQ